MFVLFVDQVSHHIKSSDMVINSHDHDGSLLQSLNEKKEFKTDISYSFDDCSNTISIDKWIDECDEYVQTNLIEKKADYLKDWTIFPPIYTDITGSKTKEITQLFKEAMPDTCQNGGMVLVEYNSSKHAEFLCSLQGLTNKRSFDNRITIFNADLTAIINIRITESEQLKDVLQEIRNCKEDSKDMITLIKFLSTNNQIKHGKTEIHNIVCATNIGNQGIRDEIGNVPYLCPECILKVITKEDLASKNKLSSWLSAKFNTAKFNKIVSLQENQKELLKIIGHITCYMANTSIKIVSPSEVLHDHTVRIQLNDEQIKVVISPKKHKLIKGGFGVGKTIIGIMNLECLARIADANTKLFFISFDSCSLLDCYVSRHMKSLQLKCIKSNLAELKISNIVSIAKDMGLKKPPKVSDILKYIQDDQKKTSRRCHLILDEVNGDLMNDIEVNEINRQLEAMTENYITIIFQPCEKHRKEAEAKGIFGKKSITMSNTFDLTKLKMEQFILSKCVRNSFKINKLVQSAQKVISSEPCVYFKPKESGKYLRKDMLESQLINATDNKVIVGKDDTASDYKLDEKIVSNDRTEEESDTKSTSSLVKPKIDLDTKHKLLDQDNIQKSSSYTTTTTLFTPIKEMGNCREGSIPRVLHLSSKRLQSKLGNQKLEEHYLMILKIVICLIDIGVKNGDVIICNNNFEITFFRYALLVLNNNSLVFAPYIQNEETPDLTMKEEVISSLEERNKVILTDMHSFCGMQSRRVIIPIHLQEKHERQNIIANIARATDELIMIRLDKTSSKKSTFGRVVKDWKTKKFVDCYTPEIDMEQLPELMKSLPPSDEISQGLSKYR